jgi:hypothetical protein
METKESKDEILKGLAKTVAQPYVEKFSDVFDDWKPYDLFAKDRQHPFDPRYVVGQNIAGNLYRDTSDIFAGHPSRRGKHANESMRVGPFCSVYRKDQDNEYLSVRAADWVLSRIVERTIIIGGDTMSFEVIDHGNGWSLVTAHHGQICGSVWLAYIRTDTIPGSNGKAD